MKKKKKGKKSCISEQEQSSLSSSSSCSSSLSSDIPPPKLWNGNSDELESRINQMVDRTLVGWRATRGQNMDPVTPIPQPYINAPDPMKPDPSRDMLVKSCKKYLDSKHCTLWQNWLLEPDKIEDDGSVTKKGLTQAAEWLADQIIAVLALTVRTGNPTLISDATRVQEGVTRHG
jgi:hypothetical protein